VIKHKLLGAKQDDDSCSMQKVGSGISNT